jgi:hypothetical protein
LVAVDDDQSHRVHSLHALDADVSKLGGPVSLLLLHAVDELTPPAPIITQ